MTSDGCPLILRHATEQDSLLLLEWRNDPFTRANSMNTSPVERDEHERWLKKTLWDQNTAVFIAERGGSPVGTVRAEYRRGETELSWTVAPGERGRGIGSLMVSMAVRMIGGVITAKIKAGNTASMRIARNAGFSMEREDEALTHWRLVKLKAAV